MQRWISTVSLQIFVIYLNDLRTGLNRLGSHCTEQQIGQIRSFCCNDHRLEKIIHACAVLVLIKDISKTLFNGIYIKKRLNTGGCQLSTGGLNLTFCDTAEKVANLILGIVEFKEKPSCEDMLIFDEALFNFICKAPYDLSPLPSKNSNLTIVMRYNSQGRKNTYKPQTTKRIRWTENDDKVFDQHIYLSKENKLYDI